jgi:hypothetical protein
MPRWFCAAFVAVIACGTENGPAASQTPGDGGSSDSTANAVDGAKDSGPSFGSDGSSEVSDAGDASLSSDQTAGGDAAVKSNCASAHLAGCYRGMYVSLYADGVGQIQFGGATEPYRRILGDGNKEAVTLAFIEAHRIESLALYDLGTILADPALTTALLSFLDRARARGVVEVNAIADVTHGAWDAIASTQKQNGPFDGVITEIEFWNPGTTFQQFTDTLSYVRSLQMTTRLGAPLKIGVYIGRPDQNQVNTMLPLIDRLYVHVYVTSPDQAYAYGQMRFQYIAAANASLGTSVEVWPIFSAEGVQWSAGAEHFMGDWLATHTLDEAENTLLTSWEANPPGPSAHVTGFQYYEGFFMAEYVR